MQILKVEDGKGLITPCVGMGRQAKEATGGKTKGETAEPPCLSQAKPHPEVQWPWESMIPSVGTRIDFLQKLR